MANIVILNGSPRKNGNTSLLCREFIKGAEESGNKVKEFFLNTMTINGCLGCTRGDNTRECPCVQNDDMSAIYPAIKESDVVVIASPLYYWNLSGQIRTAFDRLFALEEGKENLLRGNNRSGILLMSAEGDEFNDVLNYYNHLMNHLHWKNLGYVLAGGNWEAGDIKGKPELNKAYELGKMIK